MRQAFPIESLRHFLSRMNLLQREAGGEGGEVEIIPRLVQLQGSQFLGLENK